jgi:allantoinase
VVHVSCAEGVDLVSAARLGLAAKGRLEPGADADLTLVRMDDPWVVREQDLEYRHRHSAFTGMRLTARVVRTILRGVTVWGEGADPGAPAAGRLVTRAAAAR